MALGYVGLVNNNRVSATVFGGPTLARLAGIRSRRNVQRLGAFILDSASPAEPNQGPPGQNATFDQALRTVALSQTGKGLIVLLSDFLIPEGHEPGLKLLAGVRGYDTWCIQILSPGEIDPALERDESLSTGLTGDLRLTDIETGAPAEVTITAALIKTYKQRLENHCAQLAHFCAAREMTHLLTRSDADVDAFILDALRRRGLLR
jgi:uncharacterized protein (DUF58 family)